MGRESSWLRPWKEERGQRDAPPLLLVTCANSKPLSKAPLKPFSFYSFESVYVAELRKKNSKPKEVSLPLSSASSNMASKSSFSGLDPLQNDDPTLTKKRKGQLDPLEKAFNLNARYELHSEIARLFYTGGLSFNIARNPHYVRAFSLATQ
ncbi:hypothetical protein ZIOFF_009659 [Zingiber officinale]|uniref:Uncharacterized protein n=1 Tax=Zingiber officinale TaxID=94328 RepID=A0A8J5HI19_ZINOF|nr:hypothetical protein ZIOFF_009659 [Zingiber officinale]